jgi:hypothetical protein
VLDLSIDYYKHFKLTGDRLATERFTEGQLRRVLDERYPSGVDDVASDRTRRSREQTKQRIVEMSLHGDTQGNAPGTKWVAVNAIIEHADWVRISTQVRSASAVRSMTEPAKPTLSSLRVRRNALNRNGLEPLEWADDGTQQSTITGEAT